MSEADTKRAFCKMIAPWDPVCVENMLVGETGVGFPDVEYIGGLAEIKWLKKWPARESTVVRLDHYTNAQRDWLLRRTRAGEPCWLVMSCREEWFVWNALAAQKVGHLTRAELRSAATAYFPQKPLPAEMQAVLRPYF